MLTNRPYDLSNFAACLVLLAAIIGMFLLLLRATASGAELAALDDCVRAQLAQSGLDYDEANWKAAAKGCR